MSKAWYNEERDRWEMDPIAVPYAVSRKLVESARIRHDWAVMFINLKGDDKEYYVDIKVLYLSQFLSHLPLICFIFVFNFIKSIPGI